MTPVKNINIWFLPGWYPSRVKPTLGNFIEKHAEAAARYCRVAVLHVCTDPSLRKARVVSWSEEKGFPVLIMYVKPVPRIPLLGPLIKYLRFRRAYRRGSKLLVQRFGGPDFIHSAITWPVTFMARRFARQFRVPYGIEEHWTGYLPSDPLKPTSWQLAFSRRFIRDAAVVMPDSTDLGLAMQNLGLSGNYITVTNVVDTKLFKPQAKPAEKKYYRLLHISTLHPVQKNFTGLLRALNCLNDIRNDFVLEVVSDGSYEPYRELARQLDLADNIRFHGQLSTAEIAELAAKCDLLVMFSRYENFPCVIPEALAAGLPVLSTRVGGIHEHVLPPLGKLVESEDEQAFAGALDDILHHLSNYDPQALHKYANTHFSYEAVGRQLLDIYERYIKP